MGTREACKRRHRLTVVAVELEVVSSNGVKHHDDHGRAVCLSGGSGGLRYCNSLGPVAKNRGAGQTANEY